MGNNEQKDLLRLTNDYVFKRIFGNLHNLDSLADFLKSALDIPADEYGWLEVDDPNLTPRYADDKKGILDVRVHTVSGNVINIEIQIKPAAAFRERVVFYAARLLDEQAVRGSDYDIIKRVISIVITDFNLITEMNSGYHSRFLLYDKHTGILFSDILEINILELGKLPFSDENEKLLDWLKLIRAKDENEMEELAKKNPYIQKTIGFIREMSEDEAERRFAEAREKERRDRQATHRLGVEEGIEIGEKRGIGIGKIEVAAEMKRQDASVEMIKAYTGLTTEEIEKL
ncbi:MAG: Rpn family recombination-promoting nuclease/putative transposase [Clostridiales Family XIII bacterium]|jgi:predicted transposase/invertase (TIGR01784 family)|nr:Rpn family recombination-promoting nuclease/putative transposase [Clostridiales Family XIII bacterium]